MAVTNSPSRPTILWVLDLDRTLIDGDLPDQLFVEICKAQGISIAELTQVMSLTVAQGESFDTITYLQSQGVSPDVIDRLCEQFVNIRHDQNLFLPGARELLQSLDNSGARSLVLTYGGNQWQMAKLRAAGLTDRQYLITDVKNKGELIQSWRQGGRYRVEPTHGQVLQADTVYLVDDKALSFDGLPADCRGYLIRWPKIPLLKSQEGDITANVTVVMGLNELSHNILV